MLNCSKVTIHKEKDFQLNGIFYPASVDKPLGTLVYLHGGGLIFGQKEDLPEPYIQILLNTFNVLITDYRLLPESTIDDIFDDLHKIYHFAKSTHHRLYYFGRSAGAYLSLIMSKNYDIKGIISYYGYYNFEHPDFKSLPHDQKHVASSINDQIKETLIKPNITTSENPTPRYLLYLYYRHQNQWLNLVKSNNSTIDMYTLSQTNLNKLPPIFIAHAINDPDVPCSYSTEIANQAPINEIELINSDVHNFDQTVTEDNILLYKKACAFLQKYY